MTLWAAAATFETFSDSRNETIRGYPAKWCDLPDLGDAFTRDAYGVQNLLDQPERGWCGLGRQCPLVGAPFLHSLIKCHVGDVEGERDRLFGTQARPDMRGLAAPERLLRHLAQVCSGSTSQRTRCSTAEPLRSPNRHSVEGTPFPAQWRMRALFDAAPQAPPQQLPDGHGGIVRRVPPHRTSLTSGLTVDGPLACCLDLGRSCTSRLSGVERMPPRVDANAASCTIAPSVSLHSCYWNQSSRQTDSRGGFVGSLTRLLRGRRPSGSVRWSNLGP